MTDVLAEQDEQHPVYIPWYRQQMVLFVAGSITAALFLVFVSMALYVSSGAAQLDLSRPGYQSVQNKVEQSDTFESFPATGSVDKKTIDDFQKLYDKQTKQVDSSDAFSSSALDAQTLGIDAPAAGEQ
ncbi:MAG: divTM7 [Candidatus Saccharibacteria bacterium]|nr:divTM7 [Candidatus Saccharibacteria bacterium]